MDTWKWITAFISLITAFLPLFFYFIPPKAPPSPAAIVCPRIANPPFVPTLPPPTIKPPPAGVPTLPVPSIEPPPIVSIPTPPIVNNWPSPAVPTQLSSPYPSLPETPCADLPPVPYPPPQAPSGKGTCPIDTLKLKGCVDRLVRVGNGGTAKEKCCPMLQALAGLDAAFCLCTVIKAKLLNVTIVLPIALQVLVLCGDTPPPGFTCH